MISKQITRRRNVRKTMLMALGLFVMIFVFTFLAQVKHNNEMEVDAASLDGFDAGYIISDWQMGNYNSMSETEIQRFLTSKNSCSNTDYDYYLRLSRNTAYQWHWKDGHFVCLSEELFGDGETIGSGETAAHILWQTAQDYKINPQALIVLLQKETGLITDPIPNNGDYRKATGYGCPDTAACSSKYYGFKNQVRNAAALFRTVLNGGWTNYPLGENYIQYNPNSDCGGSVVNVRSLATSALYRYTPYQPNQGALDAGYGTAYCGAYGNRNFYLYFEDWFGGIKDEKAAPSTEVLKKKEELKDIIGEPLNDLTYESDGRIWQAFENGTIIYHKDTGAHFVLNGVINTKWGKSGGSNGILGKPINDTSSESDGRIWQAFEKGTIVYHEDTGAWIVLANEISKKWAIVGGSLGVLGTPVNDQEENEDWIWQDFKNGGIIYRKNGNSDAVSIQDKLIYEAWKKAVIEEGVNDLGMPISMQFIEEDGRRWQTYQNGVIIYHPDNGGYAVVNGAIHDVWASAGGSLGGYGRPISNQSTAEDGTIYQLFLNGKIEISN